ncbi:hypothetical protein [Sphingobacterium hungaricum]|uniref:Uncharacterized protein n=1 Tax=Sphingobacterium hungaricum TaxID=2082723 RepID=A0A928UX48_9SPHI|nr:hypothetical protein [Sphingobacterium hungaricum]MBE8712719.1 hypothetical protein [Sphingobacterium hungaricum]
MYEKRITFFIDILGLRNIVEKTGKDKDYCLEIFNVLNSMRSENINAEMFLEINETEESKKEMDEIKRVQALFSKALIGESSIRITHFSDSVVLSIGLENDMYAMSLIEYVGRLIYRLWKDFKILIRGAVSVDDLVHVEGGPLFGPAMVNAYDLETNLADYPRIIFDDFSYNIIINSPSYGLMKNLFVPFSGQKEINGKMITIHRGFEMNLATVLKHLMNSHFTLHPDKKKEVENELNGAINHLELTVSKITSEKVKMKYNYLIGEIKML